MTETYQPDTPRKRGDYDAPHMSPVTPAEDARTIMINKVSWGAVLAGVVVALVTQLILNLIGIGIGASTLDPGAGAMENPSASGFSISAGIWWSLAGVIAAFVGGYASGRLAGKPKESTAGWHGLTTWALTTLVVFYLLTSAVGGILGGAYRTVTGIASAAGGAAQTAAQVAAPALSGVTDPFSSIEQALRGSTGGNDPAALRDAAIAAMRAAVSGDEAKAQEARERAAQAIAKAQNIPVEQARTQVQQYEQQYRAAVAQAKDKATQVADAASKAVSRGALFGSLALLLGAIAGWLGGRMGAVEPTITARMGLSPIASGPVGHATATVKGTGGRRSTSEPVSRRS
jgi:hypothetical protein